MQLAIMIGIVIFMAIGASILTNYCVTALEKLYFKRALSMEYFAWLRVMFAGILYVFVLAIPTVELIYTLKLISLANIAIQTMKLNGVYKLKRRNGAMPVKPVSPLARFNPFKKK
ncbi:hypothetical protein EXW94_25360 [Enterobacter sp. JMULE2]|uniref:hypothetical protein n=1 Tax=Enterobacter sp. JMULE2 TaxID=2518340 RepID=UPI002815AA30|nr:hypothetical protein [Enterobacter sp. JMULE2]NTZ40929.1 hypothetical protein [Enterobacter sp. JMULE2]